MKEKIEIEVTETMQSICKALGTNPQELFLKLQNDLLGSESGSNDDRMLLHLYLAQSISNSKNVDRSKVEDFLTHIMSLKNQFDQYNYTYLLDEAFANHKVVCDYCQETQIVKTD